MQKPKMLLILGGLRIGDTFHIIPFLKKACEKYHVHWIHGAYAKHAVEFIRDHIVGMDISNEVRPELKSLPGGYPDVKEFALLNMQDIDQSAYDVVVPPLEKIDVWFPDLVCPNMTHTKFNIAGVEFDRRTDAICALKNSTDKRGQCKHVVVQPTTVSAWKSSNALYCLGIDIFNGLTVYNVGAEKERTLVGVGNLVVKNGCSFEEVARLLMSCAFAVTLHSAVACLAYHLGTPLICCSFMAKAFPFQIGRPNNTMLITPTRNALEDTIKDYMQNPRKHIKEAS